MPERPGATQSASRIRLFSFKSGRFHGLSAPERPAELLWLAARAETENSQLCCTASRYFTHRIALPLTGGPRQEAPRVLKTPLQPARQTDRHGNRQHLMVGSGQLQRFSQPASHNQSASRSKSASHPQVPTPSLLHSVTPHPRHGLR